MFGCILIAFVLAGLGDQTGTLTFTKPAA